MLEKQTDFEHQIYQTDLGEVKDQRDFEDDKLKSRHLKGENFRHMYIKTFVGYIHN